MRRAGLLLATVAAVSLTMGDAGARGHVTAGPNPRLFHAHVADPKSPTKMPLVVMIHGLMVDATMQDIFFQLRPLADTKRFAFAYPDGTRSGIGAQMWNATDACCQFPTYADASAVTRGAHGITGGIIAAVGGPPLDDVGHIKAVIDTMVKTYPIDEKRIFLVGHSNGAFMALRVACEDPRIAAVVSLAGSMPLDASKCTGTHKVSVLQIHNTADEIVPFSGGTPAFSSILPIAAYPRIAIPSARQTVDRWAQRDGCPGGLLPIDTIDLEARLVGVNGKDTTREKFACPAPYGVELWTINGGSPALQTTLLTGVNSAHIPRFYYQNMPGYSAPPGKDPSFPERIYEWLSAHPKP